MILIALLQNLLLELLAVTCQEWIQGRIIGGYAPPPYTIKYMVSIQSTSGQHFCGGTLINKYWVLTAAHCDVGVEHMMIIAGDYSLSMYEGTEQFYRPYLLIPHPDYNKTTHNADIMLIKLRAPVVLNSYVSFAPLPRQDASVAEGRVCRVSGWGRTSPAGGQIPSVLRTVKLPIVSTARCNSSDSFNGSISENMICAGYSAKGARMPARVTQVARLCVRARSTASCPGERGVPMPGTQGSTPPCQDTAGG
ncbi:hypothetical protein AALO_G00057770 [Alosa alosa]|uniref:trypsin n=1 Tax=Alosa alosa TaxID=278164 RepID=A0AAV6H695_9TELE|nr:hypothetical protein AALO_G00057770 [Alosa alosa]